MSDTILTEPIILDETGQDILDKLDAIISALNPNAQGVSFDKTGCEIITANNVQGALTQLDSGLDDTNASLANKIVIESKSLTFTSSVAVLAKKTGYVLLQVYGIRPNTETTATYHIDGWIASSDGENYYVHSSYNNLNAGLSCRVIWLKTNE